MLSLRAGTLAGSLLVAAGVSPSHGMPALPTFEITGVQCPAPSPRTGSGFLAEDWTAPGKHLLITSLHVIDGCRSVQVRSVTCDSGNEPNTGKLVDIASGSSLLVWPSRDLVAIRIPEGDSLLRASDALPGRLTFEPARPDPFEKVAILGRDAFAFCPRASGEILSYIKVSYASRRLAGTQNSTPETMQGSLDPEAVLMVYTSIVGPGTSGAPVLHVRGREVVLGIHIAGYGDKSLSWSILAEGLDESPSEPIPHTLGEAPWPPYTPPGLRQASFESLTPEIDAAVLEYQKRQLATYREVVELFKGVIYWAREALIRYDRYAGDVARLDRDAAVKMAWAVQQYEPFGQRLNTGDGDVLRARLTTLWGPVMAFRYSALLDEALAIHHGAIFPIGEINRLIRAAAVAKGREKERKIQTIEQQSRELRSAYEPRLDTLRDDVDRFTARLEEGLQQLGLLESVQ